MYCKVAPIRRFPRSAEPYDYRVPEDLTVSVGSFVEVPLRRSAVAGIVVELMETTEIKRVSAIAKLLPIPAFSVDDMEFYRLLARQTYQSLSSILYAAIPTLPKRLVHKTRPEIPATSFPLSVDEVETLKGLLSHVRNNSHTRVCLPNDRLGIGLVFALLKSTSDPLLILVPDVHMAQAVYTVARGVTDSIQFLFAKQSNTEAYESWIALREGTSRVIIATRKGALVPPHASVRTVMLGSGEDDFTQWDQNPHYDARWCVRMRRTTHPNPTTELDTFPRMEDGDLSLDLWPDTDSNALCHPEGNQGSMGQSTEPPPPLQIVNMQSAQRLSEHYLLSNEAIELIANSDTTLRPLLIFFNRLQRADDDKYVGVESLAQLIRDRFPGQFVHVVDAASSMPPSGIVIITRTLLYQWNYLTPAIAGLIILRPQHNLIYRGFRSLERATRELRRLVGWAATAHAPCLIQAREPDIVRKMLGSTQELREEELGMRNVLKYPPYGELHVVHAKDKGSRELLASYKLQHATAGTPDEIIVRLAPSEYVEEWLTWPPSCDMLVSPDEIDSAKSPNAS